MLYFFPAISSTGSRTWCSAPQSLYYPTLKWLLSFLSNLPRFPPRGMSSAINPTHSSLFTRPRDGLIRKAWSGLLGIGQQYSYVTTLQYLPLFVLFSVNLIKPCIFHSFMGRLTFVSSFPPKQSFWVVVAFWCHCRYQQVFELCVTVNQHKHFDETVLLSLAWSFWRNPTVFCEPLEARG